MNKKTKILIGIIVVIIICVAAAGLYFTIDQSPEYTESSISQTCSIDLINNGNLTNSTLGDCIYVFNETKYGVTVVSYNSEGATLSSLSDMLTFTNLRDSYKNSSAEVTIANQTCYYNNSTGFYLYIYGDGTTNDNVLIITKDKTILEHMIGSIKVK